MKLVDIEKMVNFVRHPARSLRALAQRSLSVARLEEGERQRFAWLTAAEKSDVGVLLSSDLFDHQFYRAQRGIAFSDRRHAAVHFIRRRAVGDWSPHPLISIAHFAAATRFEWGQRGVTAMLAYLESERGLSQDWSPTFDPRKVPLTEDEALAWPAVRRFIRSLTDETLLPTIDDLKGFRVTWGAVRRHLIHDAALIHSQASVGNDRPILDSWDEDAERNWVGRLERSRTASSTEPTVSIIMPAWNRVHLVGTAMESVLAQIYSNWELIVVDDGSTDGTDDLVEKVSAGDRRITLLREEHRGAAAARNRGLELATGHFVAFLDTDNVWRPSFLRTMVAAMVENDVSAAYAAVCLIQEDNGIEGFRGVQTSLDRLRVQNDVDLNALVVETSLARKVGGFDETIRRRIDHDLILRLAEIVEPMFMPFVGVDYDNSRFAADRITVAESDHWEWVVLNKALIDWEEVEEKAGQRVPGLVSIVIPVFHDFRLTTHALRSIHESPVDHELEIIVVDNGSMAAFSMALGAALACFPNVKHIRLPRNYNFAIGSNVGLAASTGEFVLFLNNDTEVRGDWLSPLLERLKDPAVRGVQPLLLYPDETIQAAGMTFLAPESLPVTSLTGHPFEDARVAAGATFDAVAGAALLMRAAEVIALHGFDSIFVNGWEDVDLYLRALERYGGHFAVEPRSLVTHRESKTPGRWNRLSANRQLFLERWGRRLPEPEHKLYQSLGLEVAHLGSDGARPPAPRPVLVRPLRYDFTTSGVSVPSLRWGIRNPATGGAIGDRWGDTHFANDLAESLRRQGQEVVTFRRPAYGAPVAALDDVVLGLRGMVPVHPYPGKINVLWVISHPDEVKPEELARFDLVYAASETWADEMTSCCGVRVRTLLQATDPAEFAPRPQSRHGPGQR